MRLRSMGVICSRWKRIAGWVTRRTDPKDRRVAHATLTRKGRRAADQIRPEMEAAAEAALAPLTPEDRARVDEGLKVLERLFGQA